MIELKGEREIRTFLYGVNDVSDDVRKNGKKHEEFNSSIRHSKPKHNAVDSNCQSFQNMR